MKKVPLSQEGLDLLKQQMSELPEAEFEKQLQLLQTETRTWLLDNLILNEEQTEYINSISDEFLHFLGKNLAIGFDYDLVMTLDFPQQIGERTALSLCKKRKVETHLSGGGTWTPGQRPSISRLQLTVGIPL